MNYWIMPAVNTRRIKKDQVISNVCEYFELSKKELLSSYRGKEVTEARSIIAYILHKKFRLSSTKTGKAINRDHSTVLYFCKKIEGFIEVDKKYKKLINNLI